jgi:hypothetical protein
MPWELIVTVGVLAFLITVLMRPDIYLKVFRGESGGKVVRRPKDLKTFADQMSPEGGAVPEDKEKETRP